LHIWDYVNNAFKNKIIKFNFQELIETFFCTEPPIPNEKLGIAQALCLPVSAHDLIFNPELTEGESIKFFLVDCRPAEQYNAGHLPTAFHLDCNLV